LVGAYTGTPAQTRKNIATARKYAEKLWAQGYAVFCPHLNSSLMEETTEVNYQDFLDGYLEWIRCADVVYLLPNHKRSNGSLVEIELCKKLNIPLCKTMGELIEWKKGWDHIKDWGVLRRIFNRVTEWRGKRYE